MSATDEFLQTQRENDPHVHAGAEVVLNQGGKSFRGMVARRYQYQAMVEVEIDGQPWQVRTAYLIFLDRHRTESEVSA